MSGSASLFSQTIYPFFPFAKKGWIAVAFDRDNYDNTRLPEWFFVEAHKEFARPGAFMYVKGYGEDFESTGECLEIPFEWEAYRSFMLAPKNYSPEYKIHGVANDWAFWADPEISVWGGDAAAMERIFSRIGGKEQVFALMLSDFHLSDLTANQELQGYLRGLLSGR